MFSRFPGLSMSLPKSSLGADLRSVERLGLEVVPLRGFGGYLKALRGPRGGTLAVLFFLLALASCLRPRLEGAPASKAKQF